jgi:hypothetical protein
MIMLDLKRWLWWRWEKNVRTEEEYCSIKFKEDLSNLDREVRLSNFVDDSRTQQNARTTPRGYKKDQPKHN